MNQSLTHNKSSHGRFRGALKSLEKLTVLQPLRHIYGTLIEDHEQKTALLAALDAEGDEEQEE